jgi:hypothetical protein
MFGPTLENFADPIRSLTTLMNMLFGIVDVRGGPLPAGALFAEGSSLRRAGAPPGRCTGISCVPRRTRPLPSSSS